MDQQCGQSFFFWYQKIDREKSECNRATFGSVNKKLYRFCFLRWKQLHSCTFARFKIWQCTGKCFHIGWFFCLSRGFIFGWGPPLFEAPGCHLAVAMSCVTLLYVARFEQHDARKFWVGPGFRMLRAQFWTLAQSKCISKGGQKWTLLGSKVVLAGLFLAHLFIRCGEALQAAMCAKSQASAAGILNWGGPYCVSVFLVFLGPKNRPFFVTGRSKSRSMPPWTPELAQVHVTDPAYLHCHPRNKIKVQVSAK